MIIINSPRIWRCHADSVYDMQAWMDATPYRWTDRAPQRNDNHYSSQSWTLGHSYEDVQRLARDGWEQGVQDFINLIHVPTNNRAKAWRYDMAGDMPDVPRYLAGDPANMRRRGHSNAHRPIVSIFVNNWINGGIRAKQMVNFGAAMVAVIDRLETSGKRVELIVGCVAPQSGSCSDRRVMSATWDVKKAEEHVDLAALAFSLAHPGASRRFGWAAWGRSERSNDSGFGCAVQFNTEPEHLIDPHPGMLYIRGMNGAFNSCNTYEDAVREVTQQINEAAGEVLVEEAA